ncbi:hypothetical protein DPEC_G00273230 [Dallia pectoralis]|uniref:Uncharacterized protein n=1 Tax=Dallia pectoralis TaxID=75939 RepID=A0ACC2FQ68_DALPE|nr:hypothetical protein DPEC_G00273230 [Dallia pectoralis]
MTPHSSLLEGLIIWVRSNARGPETFPLALVVNGRDGRGGLSVGRKGSIEVTSRFHLPPAPPYLASPQAGASPLTMGKFSVSGWLKMLTLEEAIEGNINTAEPREPSIHPLLPPPIDRVPFPFSSFLL